MTSIAKSNSTSQGSTLPVALMSGYSEEDFGALLDTHIPTVFLEKPFSPRQLAATVARLARRGGGGAAPAAG